MPEPIIKLNHTPRPEILTIKLSQQEKIALRDRSERECLSVSAIVRRAIFMDQ